MQQIRRENIKELLRSTGFVNVQEIAGQFGVTAETVRRDLEALERDGLVRRIHGGAVSTQPLIDESAYTLRQQYHTTEKQAIARTAADLIQDGDTVLIAPGTTTLMIARQLRARERLNVITNSLPVAMELADCPGVRVSCLGGHLCGEDYSTVGVTAMQNLELFNANKLIIGIGAISLQHGLTDYRMDESALLRFFVQKADCVIGIADHSKFGVTAMYNICPAERLTHLITDSGTPEELYTPFMQLGVQVHVVYPEDEP